jgi:serine/threonine protein kinase
VACKLHGLNAQWSEEKKQSYIRHAIREYNIHKTLVHPNIVRLWDIFEIDHNTFCTVLEYCSGIICFLPFKSALIWQHRSCACFTYLLLLTPICLVLCWHKLVI